MRQVIVVGGGASGLIAAIAAARSGANVTVLEKKDRVGKKILSTGNGRCNLTNTYMDISCFRSDDTTLISHVLRQFGYKESLHFFEELGVMLKERNGYVYPYSDQASTILDALSMELKHLGVTIRTEERVVDMEEQNEKYIVLTEKETYRADAVILATGGKSAPVLGSDGTGYALAKKMGHHLSTVVPALVQLRCSGTFFKQIAGIRTQAKVSLYVENKFVACDTGELQLTNYGISGIPVFQISRFAAKARSMGKSVCAEIDFFPHIEEDSFVTFMKNRIERQAQKSAEEFVVGLCNNKLGLMLLKESQIPSKVKIEDVFVEKLEKFIKLCKHFSVVVEDTNDFEQSQVSAGGVKTTEINPQTMESIYKKNLYITGELLDVDGICGGYNLQWAWSTGYIAGIYAAKGSEYDKNQSI